MNWYQISNFGTFKFFILHCLLTYQHQNVINNHLVFISLVVTGCTKGIGLCYAQELAKRGMNLILIARKAELLNKIATTIHTEYGVQVEVIIADFGKGSSIYKDIKNGLDGKDIGILINNVGVASDGVNYFHTASEETMWNMINVNMGSVTIMMKIVLPKMEARGKGAIVNVSSMASVQPQIFMTQYSASKAYVDFLSRGMLLNNFL